MSTDTKPRDRAPWLREWKAVAELYARLEALKDLRRREAELHGINTRPKQ